MKTGRQPSCNYSNHYNRRIVRAGRGGTGEELPCILTPLPYEKCENCGTSNFSSLMYGSGRAHPLSRWAGVGILAPP